MLVVTRHPIPPEESATWVERARGALAALADRPGYVRGWIGRATDDPGMHLLAVEFDSVGAARRALSNHEVRYAAWELLGGAIDEVTSYEVLHERSHNGGAIDHVSALARDAGVIGLGHAAAADVEPA